MCGARPSWLTADLTLHLDRCCATLVRRVSSVSFEVSAIAPSIDFLNVAAENVARFGSTIAAITALCRLKHLSSVRTMT
eukprot:935509-Pleurochrysis_carterae.AAC.2